MDNMVLWAMVLEQDEIAPGVMQMRLEYRTDENVRMERIYVDARPGRFVNVYLNRKDLLLPRPISICRVKNNSLSLVYAVVGAGTKELATYREGTLLRVSAPLGNDFLEKIENVKRVYHYEGWEAKAARIGTKVTGVAEESALVIGGGLGVPPMLELTCHLIEKGLTVDAVLGYRKEPFLVEAFEKAGARVHIASEYGTVGLRGTVVDLMRKEELLADKYFACGPKPMLKAVTQYCGEQGKDVLVSLEERMGCGYGACLACTCKTAGEEGTVRKRVCKDGPIFFGSEVEWDA